MLWMDSHRSTDGKGFGALPSERRPAGLIGFLVCYAIADGRHVKTGGVVGNEARQLDEQGGDRPKSKPNIKKTEDFSAVTTGSESATKPAWFLSVLLLLAAKPRTTTATARPPKETSQDGRETSRSSGCCCCCCCRCCCCCCCYGTWPRRWRKQACERAGAHGS